MTDWTCWRDASHPVQANPLFGWPQCTVCHAAPAYHERGAYLPADLELTLYVPAIDRQWLAAQIAPGAGIVGMHTSATLRRPESDLVLIYYEGWIHGAMQYADRDARGRWEAAVHHAADRMVTDYPTTAQAYAPAEQLRPIGTYNPTTGVATVTDEAALAVWLEAGR